jgi:hypothetical protein
MFSLSDTHPNAPGSLENWKCGNCIADVQTSDATTIDLTLLDSDEEQEEATPEPGPPIKQSASRDLRALFPGKTLPQRRTSPLFVVASTSPHNQLAQWLNHPARSSEHPREKRPRKLPHASRVATRTPTAQLIALGTWKTCQG